MYVALSTEDADPARVVGAFRALGLAGAEIVYLHGRGNLSFDKPEPDGPAVTSFVSDPRKPVPYTKRPIQGFDCTLKALSVEWARARSLFPD